jgi:diguanylate cyclase (GGDEF)-like protein
MLTNIQTTQSIINAIPNPIIVTNGEKMLMANDNFLEFHKVNNIEEFLQEHKCVCELFQDKEGYFSLNKIDNNTLWTEHIFNSNTKHKVSILCSNNHSHLFNLSVKKIEGNYFVVFTNITAVEKNEYYQDLAYHDHLTKIYNRQKFDKLYKKELENHKRYGDDLSIIMLDIDYFKQLNDTYGHDVGDKVLVALSELISKHLRTNDIFARWGGEEFMILLPRTNIDTAYQKAEELRKIIDKHKNKIPHFTVSFGVTQLLDYDKELSAFIRVDKALYQAKINRNEVVQL